MLSFWKETNSQISVTHPEYPLISQDVMPWSISLWTHAITRKPRSFSMKIHPNAR